MNPLNQLNPMIPNQGSQMTPAAPVPNLSSMLKEPQSESQGPFIFVLLDQITQKEIQENLFKVLQKLGTSSKTKLLHPIIEKQKYKFTAGMVSMEDNLNMMTSSNLIGNKLGGFYINIYNVLEPEDRLIIKTIMEIISEINTNKSKITDNNDYVLANLVKNKQELSKELVQKLNYFKIIDLMYFEYLSVLTRIVKQKQNIFKIMETASNTIGSVISNLIHKLGGNNPEIVPMCQKMMLLYLIQHYSTNSDGEIKVFLYKSGLINEDEYRNYIRVRTLEDVSKYLTISGILNISPNSLRNNIKNVIGDEGLAILERNQIEKLIAYLILNKNQNELFNTYLTSNIYKENLVSLEQLLLNAKSYLII